LSIVLVGVGLYIRLGVMETPVFRRLVAENTIERAPVAEVLRLQWRPVILSALIRMSEQAPFYIFTTFIFAYGTTVLAQPRNFLITAVLVGAIGSALWIPLFGYVSDRWGRKRTYVMGSAVTLVFGFLYFAMLNTGVPALIFLAIFLSLIPHDIQYGPQAAFIAEQFTPRLRYSGASIGYQLASVFAGGPAPLIATWLFATYHSWTPIAVYIAACSVITLVACTGMHDHTGADIADEYAHTRRRIPARA
jgi:MFS family permease